MRNRREMTEAAERLCVGCEMTEEEARLETCGICNRHFCADCAYRAGFGRRFCSLGCGQAYYFGGEAEDDDENSEPDD